MLIIEKAPYDGSWVQIDVEGHSEQEIIYHVMQLAKAGLIEADDVTDFEGADWKAKDLTPQGHDFLEAARNESIWRKSKEFVLERGGGLTFDVLKAVLAQFALKQVGL